MDMLEVFWNSLKYTKLSIFLGIQEWTKKSLWKTAFKNFEVIWFP